MTGAHRLGKVEDVAQFDPELVLDGPDTDPLPVACRVHVGEERAGVEQVGSTLFGVVALGAIGMEHRHQRGGAVDHGGVDDAPSAAGPGGHDTGKHAEREKRSATTEIAHEIQRGDRRLAGLPMACSAPVRAM